MIRVYYTRLEPLLNDSIYEGLRALIPSSFLHRADRYKNPRARALSLAAYSCLWAALSDDGNTLRDLSIYEGEKGKPYFKDSGVHFSISHSGSWAVAAVAPGNVAVDIECRQDFKESICHRYFSPQEAGFVLNERDSKKRENNFFRLWTLKEAYSKLSGEGIASFGDFEFKLSDNICFNHKNMLKAAFFKEFSDYDFLGAIAFEGEDEAFCIKEINLIKLLIK